MANNYKKNKLKEIINTNNIRTVSDYSYGDLARIAKETGYSYGYVRDILVVGRRTNDIVKKAARIVIEERNKASRKIKSIA